jgi:hypothetical protein
MPRMGIQTQPGGWFTAGSNLKQLIAEAFEGVLTVARADGRLGPQLTRSTPECIEQVEQRKNGGAPPKPMTPAEASARWTSSSAWPQVVV